MTLKDVAIELKKHSKVLIFCHNRPDGDTLGSAFALKHALEQKEGKIADVVCAQQVPEKYGSLEFIGKVYLPTEVDVTFFWVKIDEIVQKHRSLLNRKMTYRG